MITVNVTDQRLRADLGLLALRLMTGTILVFHGSQKLFGLFGGHGIEGTAGWMESLWIPFPTVSTVLAGGTEFFGGLAFLAGLFVRVFSAPVAFALLVGAWTAHSSFDATKGGMEYPLLLGGTQDKKLAGERLPDLSKVASYPTTIFIGRDGKVRRIYSGFSGPATGEDYEALKTTLRAEIEKLLAQE